MQIIDDPKEATVTNSRDEPTAPQGQKDAPSRPQDLWSAMGHSPTTAVVVGLLLGVLLAVIGAVTVLSGRVLYTSSTTMLIDDPYQLATSGQVSEFSSLDALRYKYGGLLATDAIAGPVASQLHLPVDNVLGSLSVNVPTDSLLMVVHATWTTPRGAEEVSLSAANEITAYVAYEDNAYAIPNADRFTFKVIDPAAGAIRKGPSKSKAATLAIGLAVLGFALGFFATQLIRYARHR